MSDQFVSDLVNAALMALIPVLIGAVGYLAKQVIAYLKAKTNAEAYAMIEKVAASVVASVEQTLASEEGQVKKDAAVALVQAEALKRGITLDVEQLENAVEAAVLRLRLESK